MCVCARARACVRACVRVCVCMCVRACACARALDGAGSWVFVSTSLVVVWATVNLVTVIT